MQNSRISRDGVSKFIGKNIILVALFVIIIAMIFINGNFLTASNFINVFRSMSISGVMACGMTMLMVSGDFDLSFGSTLGLTTCLVPMFTEIFQNAGMSLTLGAIIGMCISLISAIIIGAINGYFVIKWNLPAMLVTIAVQYAVYGIAGTITKGFPRYVLPSWFDFFGKTMIAKTIPVSVIIFLVVLVFFYILLAHTKFGRTMYAVGGNKTAAHLSGINTKKYKMIAFIAMQITAWIAGIIFCSQVAGGTQTYGKGMEFTVITAVIIGGISISGGGGSIKDTFIGLLFLSLIMNAMTIANLGEYSQYLVRGIIMLGAIVMSEVQKRWSAKKKIMIVQEQIDLQEKGTNALK